jgi:hypothetical protein
MTGKKFRMTPHSVILSAAKDLLECEEILHCVQDDGKEVQDDRA